VADISKEEGRMTIKQQQHLLAYLGYYVGDVDGKYGTLTRTATEYFQRDFGGLEVDGVCGAVTEKALTHAVAYGMPAKKTDSTSGDFWDDIEHFSRKELKCKCGNIYCNGYPAEPQEKLVRVADKVREHFGSPATVSSGLRCKQHNANVGGVSNSRHLTGKAMDFCIKGKSSAQVLAYVQKQSDIRYAYAIDSQFVHMDIL
jgi:peptidoglycan hydrolase-like protein with peptidoglycan-binding domain